MSQVKILCLFICIAAVGISCSNQSKKKSNAESVEEVIIEEANDLLSEIPVPKSNDVIKSLNKAGAGFVFDITNKPENVDNYLTLKQQALNLGVYTADLTYATVYQKKDEVAAYIQCFAQLGTNLQLGALNENLMKRFEANMDNSDSIVALLDEAFVNANTELDSDERSEIALFALAGSWIEGMFIVEKAIEFAANPEPLWEIITQDYQTLVSLIKVMELAKDNENITDLYESLVEIEVLFAQIEKGTTEDSVKEALIEKIKELRNSIV